jgi:hypothetical protein
MYDIIITDLETDSKTIFEKVDMNFILTYLKRFETKLVKNRTEGESVRGNHKNSKNVKINAK